MPVLRRSPASKRILDLTERLAEEYDAIPLPEVARVVHDAAASTSSLAVMEDQPQSVMQELLGRIENIARADLQWVASDHASRGPLRREPAGRVLAVAGPRAPHRGAA